MNFLAHIYLSGDNDELKIGNFIADGIRGKRYKKYPLDIQRGILLHRQIDSFTDAHPIVRKSKKRLHPRYRHYDGVIIDILYDHYLAKNWSNYSQTPLKDTAQEFYALLEFNYDLLPNKIQNLLPYMIKGDWLYNYRTLEGIENVLIGMNRRTKNISKMNLAIEDLNLYYTEFENDFKVFFEDLRVFSYEQIELLK
ncbi:ACP phosphodiesterase [Aureibaculum sp. 2210JD6-5]|uniref:acyl carrier protein phosphodiesterase n=1 Tax=Aureibaculum sp. 2210JD6-5 TaxID=3103957 RepID=UPI002AACCCAC|nr:ACP phosphodiesterase [Aureibaculum sp. 2210JD6-5]MDY7395064.1 ACP phosphodiesterase [Aureibaculum sp. 2210JD6-5]